MGYPVNPTIKPKGDVRGQRVQDLVGDRNNPEGQAVTIAMAAKLGQVAVKAQKVSAAPTAAEFNALVDDIAAIAATLNAMGARFTGL